MSYPKSKAFVVPLLGAMCLLTGCNTADSEQAQAAQPSAQRTPNRLPVDKANVDRLIAEWPERPRLGAETMMAKYGLPQEATSEKIVWHNQGPFKRIMVTREEAPHDFPRPHMDFLEHTISYRFPADMADEVLAYDGSVTINRTAGEMSARCDLEGHNILTLNLAHDIIIGSKDAEAARAAFGKNVTDDTLGKNPPYVTALQFDVAENTGEPDQPVIPGSPRRAVADAGTTTSERGGDAEILGFVVALDDNEVLAAAAAATKKISARVLAYAKMLHTAHGKNLDDTLKLGLAIGVTPLETPAVDKLRKKGAGELAELVPLDGEEFEAAFIAAMVKGHADAITLIDAQLATAQDSKVQAHLKLTRAAIESHLQQAKELQGSPKR